MLLREEYRLFAEDINAALAWKPFAVDMWVFYIFTCIAPPLSASVMVRAALKYTVSKSHLF
jgi:hypothetical protein